MTDIMDIVNSKRANIKAQSGRREKTHKPQPGKNRYRILPSWRDASLNDPTFFHDFGQHFIKDQAGAIKAVYLCTEKTFGKPCPVCEAVAEGIMSGADDITVKALENAKSKGRILFNALHAEGEDPKSPVILDLTPTTAEKVLDLMGEYGDITALTGGTEIVITRTGTGLNTEYSVMPAAKSPDVDPAVMAKLHNLDDYVKQEYDEGLTKAIGAVSTVSGVLPAPDSVADSLAAANLLEQDPADVPSTPAPEATPAASAPPPPPAPAASAPPPPPAPATVTKYLYDGKTYTADELKAGGWNDEQINALPEAQEAAEVAEAPAATQSVADVADAASAPMPMSDDELDGLLAELN